MEDRVSEYSKDGGEYNGDHDGFLHNIFTHEESGMRFLFSDEMPDANGTTLRHGDAMKKYGNYLIKGDYEKFVDGLAFDESVGAEKMKEQKDGLVSMLKEKVSKEYEKKDGLKSIEIISEEISEDGNTATVKIKQTYGNGETQDGTQSMVKRDGKWLMSVDK